MLRLKSAWRLCLLWCLCRPVPCRAPAGWAPLAAKWSSGVGVRFPVAGRRRDHLSEGSRRREAPLSTWRPRCQVSRPRPPHDPHRTPHLPTHTPRARSRALCFHHSSPLAPFILAGDARLRWSSLACAQGAPEPLSGFGLREVPGQPFRTSAFVPHWRSAPLLVLSRPWAWLPTSSPTSAAPSQDSGSAPSLALS